MIEWFMLAVHEDGSNTLPAQAAPVAPTRFPIDAGTDKTAYRAAPSRQLSPWASWLRWASGASKNMDATIPMRSATPVHKMQNTVVLREQHKLNSFHL